MARFRFYLLALIASLAIPFLAGCQDGGVVRLADRAVIPFDRMTAEASKSRVVIVGETHDAKAHHDLHATVYCLLGHQDFIA